MKGIFMKSKIINILIIFILTIILLQNAFNLSSTTKINYKEDSKLDYKVYLKTNEFYEEEYLGKNKVYVSYEGTETDVILY